jgi:hypothetical protein
MELRRLRFSNRPVTSQESKRRLERFFTTTTQSTSSMPAASSASQPSQTNIRTEINELGSQQIVSNVLRTTRDLIERSLQNILANRLNNQNNATRTSINASSAAESINLQVQTQERTTETNLPRQQQQPQPQPQQQQQQQQQTNVNNPNGSRPWLTLNVSNNTIEQITREQIIDDIDNLVSRQLVRSSLQSAFRTQLENHVMDSLRRSGTDGNRTRQAIRDLARNASALIQPNDFTHLGLLGRNRRDSRANISDQLGSTSQRAPIASSREFIEMKNEIAELKSLLKLSFELQMDMQRALKQEISSLIAGTFHSQAVAASIPSAEGKCVICTEAQIDTVFYSCGHMAACYQCSMNLKLKNHNCPMCRAPIKDIVRTYKTNLN